jgi:hypothetical protein
VAAAATIQQASNKLKTSKEAKEVAISTKKQVLAMYPDE